MKQSIPLPSIVQKKHLVEVIRILLICGVAILLQFSAAWLGAESHPEVWKQALPGYQFRFPRDHACHPEYRIEWWYYTGNLSDLQDRRFGYQLTFFRIGVDPKPSNPSRWAVRDLFMAHLAVSDINRQKFRFNGRTNRAGIGWAGAETEFYRVWNENWEAKSDVPGKHHLSAVEGPIGIELELEEGKLPTVHGEQGVSQKGAKPGNASHYYSLTRMPTRGSLILDGARTPVTGLSWMDHEFGTSFLEESQVGWDWFSLQLEDGSEIMLFQLRRKDGSQDTHSAGTLVGPQGGTVRIASRDFRLQGSRYWHSPASGATYPLEWDISIPGQGLTLQVQAAIPDQELRFGASSGLDYWEGSVVVTGMRQEKPINGRGYLEMTGYTGIPMSGFFQP